MKDFKTVARNTRDEFEQVTAHLFEQFYIDLLDKDVITGIAIEPLLRGPDFYAQFVTEIQFSVISDDRKLGDIPLIPALAENVNIYLGAKVWKIIRIETSSKKIIVKHSADGNAPIFLSGSNPIIPCN